MNQEINSKRVKVLPIMCRRCELPWFLEGKLYADFTNPTNYEHSLNMLLTRLDVKENIFPKQSSVFQNTGALLLPIIKQANAILAVEKSTVLDIIWEHGGPEPDRNLVDVLEDLRNQYLTIRSQILELLVLTPEQLSMLKRAEHVYSEIKNTRKKKMLFVSLLETESNANIRHQAKEDLKDESEKLSMLQREYAEAIKQLKMSFFGESLWSIETILEVESKLDAIQLRAYRIDAYNDVIGS